MGPHRRRVRWLPAARLRLGLGCAFARLRAQARAARHCRARPLLCRRLAALLWHLAVRGQGATSGRTGCGPCHHLCPAQRRASHARHYGVLGAITCSRILVKEVYDGLRGSNAAHCVCASSARESHMRGRIREVNRQGLAHPWRRRRQARRRASMTSPGWAAAAGPAAPAPAPDHAVSRRRRARATQGCSAQQQTRCLPRRPGPLAAKGRRGLSLGGALPRPAWRRARPPGSRALPRMCHALAAVGADTRRRDCVHNCMVICLRFSRTSGSAGASCAHPQSGWCRTSHPCGRLESTWQRPPAPQNRSSAAR